MIGIDHVCLALPVGALDGWALFLQAFGLELAQRARADPYGLVRCRALRSRDGSLRIVLNASVDRHTAVAERFMFTAARG